MIEIDGIIPRIQNTGSQIDVNSLHTEPAIIPLEATQADPRSHTDTHFYDLPNSTPTDQATENGHIILSETAIGPENTENSCPENQITQQHEPNEEDMIYKGLNDWQITDETGYTTGINQILPPTDLNYNILEYLQGTKIFLKLLKS